MVIELKVPEPNGSELAVSMDAGQILFVLGANGTGKSSLMQRFYGAHLSRARRISAHRQTWFSSGSLTLSPHEKRSIEESVLHTDANTDSRWKDDYASYRANLAIYDLIDAENVRARSIAEAVDAGAVPVAQELAKKDAPIKIINELLRLSNIPIKISVQKNEQIVASKNGSPPYSIAELSDGERNALLIATNVLTAPEGTLLIIDEPERHLHRSIISPLLSILFSKRADCSFVVSTHDVMLPLDNPSARTVLIRGCAYHGSSVKSWEADLVPAESDIDDTLKKDILGARRTLLFVEGEEGSLDRALYSLLFPDVSIICKASCRDVEHAVFGIRNSSSLHWLRTFGIIDNDNRTPADLAQLREKGVHALSVHSVESLYYHPEILSRVADRHASVTGEDAAALLTEARAAALAAVIPHVKRLSERAVEKTVRGEIDKHWPKLSDIAAGAPIQINIDVAATVRAETIEFQKAITELDLLRILSRYPVRETPMLTELSRKLGFQGRSQYENAARKLLMDDNNALEVLRSQFGSLIGAMSGQPPAQSGKGGCLARPPHTT